MGAAARGSAAATRARIRAAATHLFRERGLSGVSVRQIGAVADSDPALVIRHFGSKERLFLDTMQVAPDQMLLFAGPPDDVGRRWVRLILGLSDETKATFLALVRGSAEPAIADQLWRAHVDMFVNPLRAYLSGPDADLRSRLVASLVGGLLYALWVVGDEVLLATDHDHLVERYGALLQQLVTP